MAAVYLNPQPWPGSFTGPKTEIPSKDVMLDTPPVDYVADQGLGGYIRGKVRVSPIVPPNELWFLTGKRLHRFTVNGDRISPPSGEPVPPTIEV